MAVGFSEDGKALLRWLDNAVLGFRATVEISDSARAVFNDQNDTCPSVLAVQS